MTDSTSSDRSDSNSAGSHAISRRAALQASGALGASLLAASSGRGADARQIRSSMGLVLYCCGIRRRWMQRTMFGVDLFEPLNFLKHCHSLGAGGMQARLGQMPKQRLHELREFAERHQLYIEAIVSPPRDREDISRFETEIKIARDANALAARTTIIPGRRYERFKTLAEFREFEKRGQAMLKRAAPIVEKHRVRLAVENHKDQRLDERIQLFERLDSEFIGACLDTGNSFALLDGAYEPIEALAPFAFSVHLKDQALRMHEDGFLLGDIPLGKGSFDLQRIVETIRKHKPEVRFTLELITRDPLLVPCLREQYWETLPDVPARDLAASLAFVKNHTANSLQTVGGLEAEQQVALEDSNVIASLKYAAESLGLSVRS